MRLIISICISLLIAGSILTAAQAADMGLACAWLFNEGSGTDISDSVGGNNGEIQGNLEWTDGLFGKALQFSKSLTDRYIHESERTFSALPIPTPHSTWRRRWH